ncbi:f7f36425-7a12-401d-87e7-aafd74bee0b2 [Sclerotinia trifoliorum]|uniref:F7f36425-7a12-401d-87e7-aafd74bee0b2 n=1 Tax=Sclerotinia trifoliorum TaxID=28548 RepID=A0A8H2VPP7_9HELO|nr:f7f36425-7a12-401d-87e7-aafd74bee0b2 [Sclerotinia trifoliorum]
MAMVLYINLPIDGLAFLIILFFLDLKSPRTPLLEGLKAIDWVGSILVIGGTLMFLFGLENGGVAATSGSAKVISLLVFGLLTWSIRGYIPIQSGLYVLPTALSLAAGSLSTGSVVAKTGWYMPPICFRLFMMTLGFGFFIDFDAYSSWAKLFLFQIVAGLGVGPLFQAPIISLHAHTEPHDIATATSTLGFIRQLAQAISVVIGQAVYQNEKAKKYPSLVASGISPSLAKLISSGDAGADIQIINIPPPDQRTAVRVALADSLKPMWLMYTCITAAGLLASFLIRRKVLTHALVETRTGLEAERENAEARLWEREMRKRKS